MPVSELRGRRALITGEEPGLLTLIFAAGDAVLAKVIGVFVTANRSRIAC